jgi:hypothetical protein
MMYLWRISGGSILLTSLLLEQSCLFRKSPPKASIVIPPVPQPAAPQPMPMPPQLPPTDAKPVDEAAQVPELPPPAAPTAPAKARPARRISPQAPPVATETVVEGPTGNPPSLTPSPLPSLQPILGQQEAAERNRRIQQYLEKARLLVLRAERSNPDAATRQLIGQVRTFLQQADEARRVDLVRAENLAERAEVLSRGLTQ